VADRRNIKFGDVKGFKYRVNPEERQGAYGLYFVRPFSIFLTYLALRMGMSANLVTVTQIVAGIAGSAFLATTQDHLVLVGLFLLQVGFILDNVDGEVARFRGQVSLTGKYLDTVGHELVVPMLYFFVGLGTFFRHGTVEPIVFGFLAGLFSLRLDVVTMSHEAVQMTQTRLNKTFDYYETAGQGEIPELYRQKNEGSSSRILYGLFAYPAIMNIISVLSIVDIVFPLQFLASRNLSLLSLFLFVYGTLIPIRRVYTIRRFVKSRATETTFMKLVGRTGDTPSPDST